MTDYTLYSNDTALNVLHRVNNPMDCLVRFKELTCDFGYIDSERLKKVICDYIDDSGLIHF